MVGPICKPPAQHENPFAFSASLFGMIKLVNVVNMVPGEFKVTVVQLAPLLLDIRMVRNRYDGNQKNS